MIIVILKEHNLSNMHKGLADSFSLYRSKSKDTGSVSKSDYIKIAYLFIQFMMKKVIYDCDEIILPYKTGKLSVVGIKQKIKFDEEGKITGLAPNWRKTKELYDNCEECRKKRQIVYNTNEHSDGIRYKFNWSLAGVMLLNKNFYNLKFTRENKRTLSKEIMNGREYIIVKRNENEV